MPLLWLLLKMTTEENGREGGPISLRCAVSPETAEAAGRAPRSAKLLGRRLSLLLSGIGDALLDFISSAALTAPFQFEFLSLPLRDEQNRTPVPSHAP